MSVVYRRYIPLVVAFVTGAIMILEYYISENYKVVIDAADVLKTWRIILSTVVFIGVINLFRVHGRHISRRRPGQWYYSAWLLFLIIFYAICGLVMGVQSDTYVRWFVNAVTVPLGATMYASLCFYMAAGAYRVLRARSLETFLLLGAAFLVIMGNTPLFPYLWPGFATIRNWIFDVIVTGGMRAIRIGVGLGATATGLKTVLGLETGYLGRRR